MEKERFEEPIIEIIEIDDVIDTQANSSYGS